MEMVQHVWHRRIRWSSQRASLTGDPVAAAKIGHKHFMLKEIFEQPRAIADTIRGRDVLDHADEFRYRRPYGPLSPAIDVRDMLPRGDAPSRVRLALVHETRSADCFLLGRRGVDTQRM